MNVILNPGINQCYLTYSRNNVAIQSQSFSSSSISIPAIAGATGGVVIFGGLGWVVYKYFIQKAAATKATQGIQMNTI